MNELKITYVPIGQLKPAEYNPRKATAKEHQDLKESITRFGLVDPIICNSASGRKNIVIGGHFRLRVARELNVKTMPVVYLNIPDLEKEKELNLRLNRNLGEWDWDLLKDFSTDLLADVGFDLGEITDLLNPAKMERLEVERPISLVWGLFKIPADKYDQIAELVEQIAKVESIQMEIIAADENKNRQHEPG